MTSIATPEVMTVLCYVDRESHEQIGELNARADISFVTTYRWNLCREWAFKTK